MHKPVLLKEVIDYLIDDPEGIYVDGTVGSGGHSESISKVICSRGGSLICIDKDPDAIRMAKKRLAPLGECIRISKANYAHVDNLLNEMGIKQVNGILLDLGMSSEHIEKSGRGFSFLKDEPLDMRMDPDENIKAKDIVNNLPETELVRIIKKYGEEKRAKAIAQAIIKERKRAPIESSLQLANIISSVFKKGYRKRHPATKTFQALRIMVNREIENLKLFLQKAPALLKKGGRLVIISYHSIEDRLVKHCMIKWENPCTCPPEFPYCICGKRPLMRRITKKGIKASDSELQDNPSSRSAILRVAEKI